MLRCPPEWEIYRRAHPLAPDEYGDPFNGYINIPKRGLRIIFSAGEGWEHASVSLADRCPTWDEMEYVKRSLWGDSDCVMQLHVPVADHKNYHPYCLHLWRPINGAIPRPPADMVAP